MNPKAKTSYDQVKDWGEKPAPWVVAGGILVLAFLLFIIGLLASDTYDTVYHDYATSKAQADAQNVFDRECAKKTAISDVLDCAKEAVKSARETQRSEEDVYAQKQMAYLAWWLLLVTTLIGIVSVAVTGIGTFFLLKTVRLSSEANAVAREIGEAQVRAYITCASAEYRIDLKGLHVSFVIANQGQSPALHGDLRAEIAIIHNISRRAPSANFDVKQLSTQNHSGFIVPAGDREPVDLSWRTLEITLDSLDAIQKGTACIIVNGRVTWVDVFKKGDSVPFVLVQTPESIATEGKVLHNGKMRSHNQSFGPAPTEQGQKGEA